MTKLMGIVERYSSVPLCTPERSHSRYVNRWNRSVSSRSSRRLALENRKPTGRFKRRRVFRGGVRPPVQSPPEGLGRPTLPEDVIAAMERFKERARARRRRDEELSDMS